MHKKSYEKLCQMIYSTNQNPYRPYKAHAQTDQDSNRMPSGDYFLESEKSNNEYEQRKYAQQTEQLLEKLLYLIWQLQIEQKKTVLQSPSTGKKCSPCKNTSKS